MKKNKIDTISREKYIEDAKPLITKIKKIAAEYYAKTGRPLGVTGEIAEYEAICAVKNLRPCKVREAGIDAIQRNQTVQIKGRVILPNSKSSQRVGAIRKECDTVMLVLLDENYNMTELITASFQNVRKSLDVPGSKARNERRSMSINLFRKISQ
jgi:hypothetical protein